MTAEFRQNNCFPVMQTGPWEGPGSWCYKVYCIKCGTEELASNREDAWELLRAHKPAGGSKPAGYGYGVRSAPGTPAKRVPPSKVAARAKRIREAKNVEKWEEFF